MGANQNTPDYVQLAGDGTGKKVLAFQLVINKGTPTEATVEAQGVVLVDPYTGDPMSEPYWAAEQRKLLEAILEELQKLNASREEKEE